MSETDIDVEELLELPATMAVRPAIWLRPSNAISPEEMVHIKSQLCERLATGLETRVEIQKQLNVSYPTIAKWVKADDKFADDFARSQEAYRTALEHRLLSLHDEHLNPAMAKVHSDNIKWVLGVQDRQRYGAKVEVTDTNNAALIDVLQAAIARIPRPSCDLITLEVAANPVNAGLLTSNSNDD